MKILNCVPMEPLSNIGGPILVFSNKIKAKRKFYIAAAIVSILASCSKDVIVGSGSVITSERTVANFSAVDVSGINEVHISYSPEISVTLKGYSNLIPHYKTEVENGTLHLHYDNNVNVRNDNLQVFISMPSFDALTMSGTCPITAIGDFEHTPALSVTTSGDGSIIIEKINADNYSVQSSGLSNIKTLGVHAKTASVEISGSSEVTLSVQDKLDVYISGDGKVSYKGDPSEVNTDISGSGEVIKL